MIPFGKKSISNHALALTEFRNTFWSSEGTNELNKIGEVCERKSKEADALFNNQDAKVKLTVFFDMKIEGNLGRVGLALVRQLESALSVSSDVVLKSFFKRGILAMFEDLVQAGALGSYLDWASVQQWHSNLASFQQLALRLSNSCQSKCKENGGQCDGAELKEGEQGEEGRGEEGEEGSSPTGS